VKPGDLVRFKVHQYHKSYGVGVLLEKNTSQVGLRLVQVNAMSPRYWALFNAERILVRLEELELISESR